MADDEKKERKALIVITVGSKREPSAGNPVITFVAHDEGDESAKKGYETWGNDLVNQVVEGARLDCEITHKLKGDQLTLRITQMFDDKGNPIRQTQRRAGGSGSYGKSDEQVRTERISIESQSAYNGIIELLKTKVIELDHAQAKTALEYAEKKMRAGMAPVPVSRAVEPKDEKKAEAKKEPPPPPKSEKVEKPPSAPAVPKITASQLTTLAELAKEKGYKSTLVSSIIIRHFKKSKAKELTSDEANTLIASMRRGDYLPKEDIPF